MSSRDTLITSSPGRQSRTPSTGKSPATSDRRSRKSSGRKSHRASGRSSRATSAEKSRRTPSRKSRTPAEPDGQDESPPRDRSSSSSPSMSPGEQEESPPRDRSSSSGRSSSSRKSPERISKSSMCNLIFPVARVKSMMKVHNHGLRVSDKTAVFTAGVLEYLTTEILELSANSARDENRITIKPNHVNRAIKIDQELFSNFKNSTVPCSKFVPFGRKIRTTSTAHGSAQDQTVSLPEPSTAPAASPSESGKSDAPGRDRREG